MIIAGYDKELDKCFFRYNQGLKRRFSSYYKIENYNDNQLKEIFKYKIKQSMYKNMIDDHLLDNFFKKNYNDIPYFGGDIEKIINEIKYSHSLRSFYEDKESKCIIYDDLEDAFSNFKLHKKDKKDKIPFGLYS